jgi:hypothetical protein
MEDPIPSGKAPRALSWLIFATLLVGLVAGCAMHRGGYGREARSLTGNVITDLVYFETNNNARSVRVVQLNGEKPGSLDTTTAKHGDRIQWINTNEWDFCIVFSPRDNVLPHSGWVFQHNSEAPVSITAPALEQGQTTKILNYSVITFEDVEESTSPQGSTSAATNKVVVTSQDPFIIIH